MRFGVPRPSITLKTERENPQPIELPQFVRTVQKHPYVGNI